MAKEAWARILINYLLLRAGWRFFDIKNFVTGAAQPKLSQVNMNRIPIPFPPLDVQRRIVEEIEAEWELVEANRKLIKICEHKIQAKLAEIWGVTSNS